EVLFTENETNVRRLYGGESGFAKDGINDFVVHGARGAVNTAGTGTKAAAHHIIELAPGETRIIRARLTNSPSTASLDDTQFDAVFEDRRREADEFYSTVIPADLSDDGYNVMRQAFAGLLWSKQFYHYVIRDWLDGDPAYPKPPSERRYGRNREWNHLYNADV